MAALTEEGRYPAVQKLTKAEYESLLAGCSADAQPTPKLVSLMKAAKKVQ